MASNGTQSGSEARSVNVVVAGATGLIGQQVVKLLSQRPSTRVFALVRQAKGSFAADVHEVPFDYEAKASYENLGEGIPCDVLLCCLGTTRKKAGSDEAFRRVDRDYPVKLINRLTKLPSKPVFGLVSSVGAHSPRGLYLSTKYEVEQALMNSGLPFVIARPSLLLGDRQEHRAGERFASTFMTPLARVAKALLPKGSIDRYAPIEDVTVARALINTTLASSSPSLVLEGTSLFDAGER